MCPQKALVEGRLGREDGTIKSLVFNRGSSAIRSEEVKGDGSLMLSFDKCSRSDGFPILTGQGLKALQDANGGSDVFCLCRLCSRQVGGFNGPGIIFSFGLGFFSGRILASLSCCGLHNCELALEKGTNVPDDSGLRHLGRLACGIPGCSFLVRTALFIVLRGSCPRGETSQPGEDGLSRLIKWSG